jgi:hypothetical protein
MIAIIEGLEKWCEERLQARRRLTGAMLDHPPRDTTRQV